MSAFEILKPDELPHLTIADIKSDLNKAGDFYAYISGALAYGPKTARQIAQHLKADVRVVAHAIAQMSKQDIFHRNVNGEAQYLNPKFVTRMGGLALSLGRRVSGWTRGPGCTAVLAYGS